MITSLPNNGVKRKSRDYIVPPGRLWVPTTALSLVVCQAPLVYGHFAFVKDGVARNDWIIFIALPFLSQVLMMIVTVAAWRVLGGSFLAAPRWFGASVRSAIVGTVLLTVGLMLVYGIGEFVAAKLDAATAAGAFLSTLTTGNAFLAIYTLRVAVMTPVVEELFWRVYVQGALQRLSGPSVALLGQAGLFALAHMRGLTGSFEVFLVGLIFGFWRWRKGTLVPLIMAHLILNGLACIRVWQDEFELRTVTRNQDFRVPLEAMCKPVGCAASGNALHDYERAFELLVPRPSGLDEADVRVWPERLSAEKSNLLRAWISSNEKAIAQFSVAAEKPYWCPEYTKEPMGLVKFPSFVAPRMIVLAVLAKARVEAVDHDLQQSVRHILMCYQFSQHLAGPKPLIQQFMGIGVEKETTRTVFTVLACAKVDQPYLQQLQSGLEAMSGKDVVPVDYSGERLLCQALIQESFTNDASGGGHMPQAFVRSIVNPPLCLRSRSFSRRNDERKWEKLDRRETRVLANELFTYLGSIQGRIPAELWHNGMDVEIAMHGIVKGNVFLGELVPGYAKAYSTAYRAQALRNSLLVVAAVMRCRQEQGHLPDQLSELVQKEYLHVLPSDPFSGAPFIYKEVGHDFVLYSLGPDFDDDAGIRGGKSGGKFNGDDVFWPPVGD